MSCRLSMSVTTLATLNGREYIEQIKARLRDDELWADLVGPRLIGRTRWGLTRLMDSMEAQIERATGDPDTDPSWLRTINALLELVKGRLNEIDPKPVTATAPTVASSREARAWRGLAAKLAAMVMESNPSALRGVQTPYGDLEIEEWLAAREAKRLSRREP